MRILIITLFLVMLTSGQDLTNNPQLTELQKENTRLKQLVSIYAQRYLNCDVGMSQAKIEEQEKQAVSKPAIEKEK